jgi:aromatic-L-amino-acid decarboxylase
MAFSAFGRDGLEARIREHCRLAREWAGWVEADRRFVLAAPVPMAVVCFRFVPRGVDSESCDRMNELIVNAVNASGEAYLTHTRIAGRIVMRIGVGNILTTTDHLRRAWLKIVSEAERIASA